MLPDRVSNPGPLTYESGALPIALRGPAVAWRSDICTYVHVWRASTYFYLSSAAAQKEITSQNDSYLVIFCLQKHTTLEVRRAKATLTDCSIDIKQTIVCRAVRGVVYLRTPEPESLNSILIKVMILF